MSEQNAIPVNPWKPIETAPKQRKIIVHYLNPLGKHRTVMACYYGEKSLEMHDDYDDVGTFDEESGTLFADAGWYEEHDSDNPILPLGGVPTHWMPLPPPPVITSTAPAAQCSGPDGVCLQCGATQKSFAVSGCQYSAQAAPMQTCPECNVTSEGGRAHRQVPPCPAATAPAVTYNHFPGQTACEWCHGTGAIDAPTSADDPSCPECDGEGHV